MLENNTIDVITGMAGRNVKVAFDLLPSAISGFVLQEGKKKDIGMNQVMRFIMIGLIAILVILNL